MKIDTGRATLIVLCVVLFSGWPRQIPNNTR
jgi:hypothetical protein